MSRSARPQQRARRAGDDRHRTGQAAGTPRPGGQDAGTEQTSPAAGPGIGGSGKPCGSRAGGLWLLLIPLACCGGPLLAAGLAAAGVLAWGGLGLMLAVALAGAGLLARHRGRACRVPPGRAQPDNYPRRSRRGDHPRQPGARGRPHGSRL